MVGEEKQRKRAHPCPHCLTKFQWAAASSRGRAAWCGTVDCRTVHERRRDHQCPHCSSRFGTAKDMRRHCKTVHEKVRAHACIYCPEDVAFGTMSTLNRHIDT